jgi:hypothetical protein
MIRAYIRNQEIADKQVPSLVPESFITASGGSPSNPQLCWGSLAPKQPLMDKLYSGLAALYNVTMSEIRPDLSEWVRQNPVDAIVIVREVNRQVPARGPSQYFAGIGLHQFLGNRPFVQVSAGIVVWDARTMEQITAADFAPAGGEYPESIEKVGDQLAGGQRIPLVPILQRLLQNGLCGSVKRVNL